MKQQQESKTEQQQQKKKKSQKGHSGREGWGLGSSPMWPEIVLVAGGGVVGGLRLRTHMARGVPEGGDSDPGLQQACPVLSSRGDAGRIPL